MQSYVAYVQSLYDGVLADIGMQYPGLRKGLSRDYVRLCSVLETDGLGFFTLVLPAAGKHFDKCLAAGSLTRFGMANLGPFRRGGVIPRLFKELLLLVFEETGSLRVDVDVNAIRCLRQLFLLMKKIELECTFARTTGEVREFFKVDSECRSATLSWDADELGDWEQGALAFYTPRPQGPDSLDLIPPPQQEVDRDNFTRTSTDLLSLTHSVFDIISSTIGVFNPYMWKSKHGPGAVSDQVQGASKYEFPYWPDKLERVFPQADFAFANYGLWAESLSEVVARERFSVSEPPCKLIAVPKTQKAPRLIASEPIAHQWCQQSILTFLRNRVESSFLSKSIHFRDQTWNSEAALRASHTGDQWTVDLSAASDRISCWLVERVFRRNKSLLQALHATRTRWIVNPIDKKSPKALVLKKFSCMGSACTFPVQTIIFYGIAVASVLHARGLKATIKNISSVSEEIRIFGDDIIVPKDAGECLDLLGYLGLKVNSDKTYRTGRFRESCGCDAYAGVNVTPAYIRSNPDKARPESITSSIDVTNNLVRGKWYNTASRVKTTVEKAMPHLRLPYLPVDSGYFGWKTPDWDVTEDRCKRRFNKHLHRVEKLVHLVVSRTSLSPDRSGDRKSVV